MDLPTFRAALQVALGRPITDAEAKPFHRLGYTVEGAAYEITTRPAPQRAPAPVHAHAEAIRDEVQLAREAVARGDEAAFRRALKRAAAEMRDWERAFQAKRQNRELTYERDDFGWAAPLRDGCAQVMRRARAL